MSFTAAFTSSAIGGLIGYLAGGQLYNVVRWVRVERARRKRSKEFGGLPEMEIASFQDGLPPNTDRRAFGQMLAYLVELGDLADPVQREAHDVIRHKARHEEYVLTPEVSRWLILMAGVSPPHAEPVWDLIDEACDVLGQEHLERKEEA